MTVVLVLYWHLASDDSVELLYLQWAMINLFSNTNLRDYRDKLSSIQLVMWFQHVSAHEATHSM